jgi:hypothetical protein
VNQKIFKEFLLGLNGGECRRFDLISRAIFKEIAKELGIKEYKIRGEKRNYAHPIEMYFYSEHLYIRFEYKPEDKANLSKNQFMFRYVRNINDYIGGCNNWMGYKFLCENIEKAVEYFKLAIDNPRIPVI